MNSNLFFFVDNLVAQTSVAAGEAVPATEPSIAGASVPFVVRVAVAPPGDTQATAEGLSSPGTIHVYFGLCIRIHVFL